MNKRECQGAKARRAAVLDVLMPMILAGKPIQGLALPKLYADHLAK